MSYERKMLEELEMPPRKEVEEALIKTLFRHNGVIKDFSSGQEIVDEIANDFNLDEKQRTAFLETIYRKENRIKKSSLWHRLLFRAADALAKRNLVSRPTATIRITNKKEWMLTEKGIDESLKLLKIPQANKDFLLTKSYEVQKIVRKISKTPRPKNYNPFDKTKKSIKITKEVTLRNRGFRQAVIEAYDYKCALCGLSITSPDFLYWEVEAAHIVPHSSNGKDDIWNGLALCRLHHWAFDVGWISIDEDFAVKISKRIGSLPSQYGMIGSYDFIRSFSVNPFKILLPKREENYPHQNSIKWHRENIFCNE